MAGGIVLDVRAAPSVCLGDQRTPPKLVTLSIGFALTLAIGTAITGVVVDHSHLVFAHFNHWHHFE
jgi:hypothetical protein